MAGRHRLSLLVAMGVGLLGTGGCAQTPIEHDNIVLQRFEDSNYALLNAAVGGQACVVGNLSVDDHGVWFLLEPVEQDGVLDTSPSRVRVFFAEPTVFSERDLRGARIRRVCGVLEDEALRDGCAHNRCRSYQLRAAQLH